MDKVNLASLRFNLLLSPGNLIFQLRDSFAQLRLLAQRGFRPYLEQALFAIDYAGNIGVALHSIQQIGRKIYTQVTVPLRLQSRPSGSKLIQRLENDLKVRTRHRLI